MGTDREPRHNAPARRCLASYALVTLAFLAVALTPDPAPPFVPPAGATSDLDLYTRIVARVRTGEGYYAAAGDELRTHGYPTRSVFNWRLPTYAWVFATLPSGNWARGLLCAGAVAGVGMGVSGVRQGSGGVAAALAAVGLIGATAWNFGADTFLFTELWAGTFILVSVGALQSRWVATGVLAGLAALFFRELALPYVAVCLALALDGKRWRESIGWGTGLLLFGLFLGWHGSMVARGLTPADQAIPGGWVRLGGLRFVLATSQANLFLMGGPLWLTAVYVPLAVVGLVSWRGEHGRRVGLTVGSFLAAFCVVGAPFNFYWGFITAPLLALGAARGPGTLLGWSRVAFPKRSPGPFASATAAGLARPSAAR